MILTVILLSLLLLLLLLVVVVVGVLLPFVSSRVGCLTPNPGVDYHFICDALGNIMLVILNYKAIIKLK